MRLKHAMQTLKGAGHCTLTKRMTSILRHVAEAFWFTELPLTELQFAELRFTEFKYRTQFV